MDKLKPSSPNPQPSASANPLLPASVEGRLVDRLSSPTTGPRSARGQNERPAPQDATVFDSPRVLVFSSQQRKLSSLSPFQRREGCDRFGKVLRCDKLRDGSIEVEFATAADAARALNATSFTYTVREGGDRREASIPMAVAAHRTKNSSKGIINCFDLKDVSDDEIAEGLSQFGVIHARHINTRRGGITTPTNNIVLTFSCRDLPPHVVVGYIRVKVRAYIPNPMRCFHCQRFGHPKTRCDGKRTCSKCASLDHTDESCQSETPWCVNCGEGQIPHPSYDRSCPKYVEEKEINTIKATRNISFREAREAYRETHPRVSYAEKVKENVKAPVSKNTSLEEMSAAQLVLLLKSFGLTVVAAGAATERGAPSPPSDTVAMAAQTKRPDPTAAAPAPSGGAGDDWTLVSPRRRNDRRSPPPAQVATTPALPRPPPAVGEALRRGEEERKAREAKRARLAQKARETKRSPVSESASAGSSRGTSATPDTPQKTRNPPEMGPPPPPPPPQRRPPPPLPAATPVARPTPAASAAPRPPQAPTAPERPPKRPWTGSPDEGQKSKPRPKFQSGPGQPRSHSADGRALRETSGHPRIQFGDCASSDGEELV